MYPVERYKKVLQSYTKNQYRPETSIVERYVAEEAIEFLYSILINLFLKPYDFWNLMITLVSAIEESF